MTADRRVAVIFGGRSVEHEVSVITAQQAIALLGESREVIPVYIAKDGAWYTGGGTGRLDGFRDIDDLVGGATRVTPVLGGGTPGLLRPAGERRRFGSAPRDIDVDVVLPLVHGSHGEDGDLAALCRLWGVPYVGCDVVSGALSMDKPRAKRVLRAAGITVLDDVVLTREAWRRDAGAAVRDVVAGVGYPAFVKPASLGSSIGVAPAADEAALREALEVAFAYDDRVIVEPAQQDFIEINCAVLGRGDAVRASVLEQPVSRGVLSYADKYASGTKGGAKTGGTKASGMSGAQRIIPAPLDDALAERIRDVACRAFIALGASGVARVDFMVRPPQGEVILNEVNTVPGALSYYLFEPAGLTYAQLLDELIAQAIARAADEAATSTTIGTWLLSAAAGGSKRA